MDRTFNCRREHTLGIWKHILDHDNGVTNFHFEVSADLFDQEELEMIGRMRPGLISAGDRRPVHQSGYHPGDPEENGPYEA